MNRASAQQQKKGRENKGMDTQNGLHLFLEEEKFSLPRVRSVRKMHTFVESCLWVIQKWRFKRRKNELIKKLTSRKPQG